MSFRSSTVVLILFGIVASLAAIDLVPSELDDLLSDSSLNINDAFNSPLPLADARVTTWNDALAFDTADGTVDGTGVLNPDNNQIPDSASDECDTDTKNSRRRVRRVWCPVNLDEKNAVPNPQSGSDTHRNSVQTGRSHNSAKPNGMQNQNNKPGTTVEPPLFTPARTWKIPEENAFMCDDVRYEDSKTPVCDSGIQKENTVKIFNHFGRIVAELRYAHPCTFIFKCNCFFFFYRGLAKEKTQKTAFSDERFRDSKLWLYTAGVYLVL